MSGLPEGPDHSSILIGRSKVMSQPSPLRSLILNRPALPRAELCRDRQGALSPHHLQNKCMCACAYGCDLHRNYRSDVACSFVLQNHYNDSSFLHFWGGLLIISEVLASQTNSRNSAAAWMQAASRHPAIRQAVMLHSSACILRSNQTTSTTSVKRRAIRSSEALRRRCTSVQTFGCSRLLKFSHTKRECHGPIPTPPRFSAIVAVTAGSDVQKTRW